MQRKAIVLLSGGVDSTTVLAIARSEGLECYALTVDYGQRHQAELVAAKAVAAQFGVVQHRAVYVDLSWMAASALTGHGTIAKGRSMTEIKDGGIPETYVPGRNTIFLALAAAWADAVGADEVFAGMNAVDYSGYPDCRPEFTEAFEKVARIGTRRSKLEIRTPIIRMTKAEVIQLGVKLGVDYAKTVSCYEARSGYQYAVGDVAFACGACDACLIRAEAFKTAGIKDPTIYERKRTV